MVTATCSIAMCRAARCRLRVTFSRRQPSHRPVPALRLTSDELARPSAKANAKRCLLREPLDHLIGAREQRGRPGETERLDHVGNITLPARTSTVARRESPFSPNEIAMAATTAPETIWPTPDSSLPGLARFGLSSRATRPRRV